MSRTTIFHDAFVDELRDPYDAQQQLQEQWVAGDALTELSESIHSAASTIDDDDDDEDDEADEAEKAEKAEKKDRDDEDDEDENEDAKGGAWSESVRSIVFPEMHRVSGFRGLGALESWGARRSASIPAGTVTVPRRRPVGAHFRG